MARPGAGRLFAERNQPMRAQPREEGPVQIAFPKRAIFTGRDETVFGQPRNTLLMCLG
jgi:hypothetical protein